MGMNSDGDTVATNDIVDWWSLSAASCRDSQLLGSVGVIQCSSIGEERDIGEQNLQGMLLQVALEQCNQCFLMRNPCIWIQLHLWQGCVDNYILMDVEATSMLVLIVVHTQWKT